MALHASGIVITYVIFNHLYEFLLTGKSLAVVTLPLENTPKALHRAVVNTMRHAGHALFHVGRFKLVVECTVRILKPSVAVKQWMGTGICHQRAVKGLEHQRIVVMLADSKSHNASVIEVENGTKVDLVCLDTLIPLEFRHVGDPLFIWLCGVKLTIQKILGKILRILRVTCAAVVGILDGGLYVPHPADAQNPLVVDMNIFVMPKIVVDATVALVRTLHMNLFNLFSKLLILSRSPAGLARNPLTAGTAGHMEQFAFGFHGVSHLAMALPDGSIDMALPYLREASLLSISSNFFSKSRSIVNR